MKNKDGETMVCPICSGSNFQFASANNIAKETVMCTDCIEWVRATKLTRRHQQRRLKKRVGKIQ